MRLRGARLHSFVRGGMLAVVTGLWMLPAQALTVLTVDAEYLESTMPLYASIGAQAEKASIGADSQRASNIELAHELRQSEVLIALPEAIAEVARAAQADLVVDRAVARRLQETGARDITREVEEILVGQFGSVPLEPDS